MGWQCWKHDPAIRTLIGVYAQEGADILREVGDPRAESRALLVLGCAPWARDQLPAAEGVFRTVVDLAKRHGLDTTRAVALDCLAIVRFYMGDVPAADALVSEAVEILEGRAG